MSSIFRQLPLPVNTLILGGPPKCCPPKTHTFGLYSTNKWSDMKVRSNTPHLGLGLIKTLINPPSFELGLMVGPKTRFSVWHRRTIFGLIPLTNLFTMSSRGSTALKITIFRLISLTNLFNMSSLICRELFCLPEDKFTLGHTHVI